MFLNGLMVASFIYKMIIWLYILLLNIAKCVFYIGRDIFKLSDCNIPVKNKINQHKQSETTI